MKTTIIKPEGAELGDAVEALRRERDIARAIAGAAVNFLRPAELRLVLMTAGVDVPEKAKRDELLAIVRAALELKGEGDSQKGQGM